MTQIDITTPAIIARCEHIEHCALGGSHKDAERMRALAEERDTLRREREEARNAALEEAGNAAAPGRIVSDDDYSIGWVDGRRSAVKAIEALKSHPAPRRSAQEAAKVLLDEYLEHGEGLQGELACYEISGDEDGAEMVPSVDGDWVRFNDIETALRALAQKEGE